MNQEIYADYNATYPLSSKHLDQLKEILTASTCANPSSTHRSGRRAKALLEEARQDVANLIGASFEDLFFTSGATEANNLFFEAFFRKHLKNSKKSLNVLTTISEHPSLLNPLLRLEKEGKCQLDFLELEEFGLITPLELQKKLQNKDYDLLTFAHVNGEVGIVQDLKNLGKVLMTLKEKPHLHLDGAQALGKVNCQDVVSLGVDSYSASGHKLGSLTGCGFLFLKNSVKQSFLPSFLGGGQERGFRPGTENLPGILSFALRAKDCLNKSQDNSKLAKEFKDLAKNLSGLKGLKLNKPPKVGLSSTISLFIENMPKELLVLELEERGIVAATGSACSSGSQKPSPTLKAIKASSWAQFNSIRLSFSCETTKKELDRIFEVFKAITS